jgi:hypothetical protein
MTANQLPVRQKSLLDSHSEKTKTTEGTLPETGDRGYDRKCAFPRLSFS